MKTISYCLCDYCGTSFPYETPTEQIDAEAKCSDCESTHKIPVNIIESKYNKVDDKNKCPHPYAVKIEFDDGYQIWYRRENS